MDSFDDIEIGLDDLIFLIVLATPFIAVFSFAAGVLYPFYT